ncbi:MAG TPA: hypothetical protein VFX70_09200 [Mycobacteriales bacterium]|nr:hypothetical protein [Mycobacteriales bacterium]
MTGAPGAPADTAGTVDPDAVAAAATACRTVAGLSGGPAGTVASYLPGRRVVGVRVGDGAVAVHVVGAYGPPVARIGAEVRAAVAPLSGGRAVDVVVEDLTGAEPDGTRPGGRQDPAPPRTSLPPKTPRTQARPTGRGTNR